MLSACGDMMALQPAYQRQDYPILPFPTNSVPVSGAQTAWTQQTATAATNPLNQQQAAPAGKELYQVNCRMCHGNDAKGTGAIAYAFPPHPADLTSAQVQQQSDGQLFWAITNGFGRMPAFGKRLTDTQRWQLVSYVRTLK